MCTACLLPDYVFDDCLLNINKEMHQQGEVGPIVGLHVASVIVIGHKICCCNKILAASCQQPSEI